MTRPLRFTPAPRGTPSRDGSVFGMVLVVMVVVSLLGIGLLRMSLQNSTEAATALGASHAFWGAEAGLEQAKARAYKNRRVHFEDEVFPPSEARSWTGRTDKTSYNVLITNAFTSPPAYLVRSEAVSDGGIIKVVEASILQAAAISLGAFGHQELKLKDGIRIYSYSSSSVPFPGPSDSTGEAIIGSNSNIAFQANPVLELDGIIRRGTDESESVVASLDCQGSNCEEYEGSSEYAGYIDPDPLGITHLGSSLYERFQTIAVRNNNADTSAITNNVLVLSGNTTTGAVTAGEYYLTHGAIEDHAVLEVDISTGSVHFYLTGWFVAEQETKIRTIGGGPGHFFHIYANGTGFDPGANPIRLEPNGDLRGFIYAPNMRVYVSPEYDFHGAVWGDRVFLEPGGDVYLDTDLLKYDAFDAYRILVRDWREVPQG